MTAGLLLIFSLVGAVGLVIVGVWRLLFVIRKGAKAEVEVDDLKSGIKKERARDEAWSESSRDWGSMSHAERVRYMVKKYGRPKNS